jgi:acetolactate synthase I/II/III large subunit
MTKASKIHGGKILAQALVRQGVEFAFGVPGESFLALLDGLHDYQEQLQFITCRQEGGAAYMADAYAKLTSKVGVLMVTRGPGAANAMVGIHTAFQDSTPIVVFVGQVGTDMAEREAFQEVDLRKMYSECAKWVGSIDRVDRIDEYVSKAFHIAQAGRKGPVVLALPEDVLFAQDYSKPTLSAHIVQPGLNPLVFAQAMNAFEEASAPLIIVGGSSWDVQTAKQLQAWAEKKSIPVVTAFRHQDLIDNDSPAYAGVLGLGSNPQLVERVKKADVVIVIGDRLGEIVTLGYTLFDVPHPKQTLIHVHPGAEEIGKVYRPSYALNCSPKLFVEALTHNVKKLMAEPEKFQQARAQQLAYMQPLPMLGDIQLAQIFSELPKYIPRDAILTNGAGNFTIWLHRFYSYGGYKTQLAPANGSMGYGLPAAIAAKLVQPRRTVIGVTGDGDFMMNCQELATAMKYDVKPIILILNNGMYGTIRMHQEREFKARVSGTFLTNPDFVMLAQSFGMLGYRVTSTEQFFIALQEALQKDAGAVIELVTEPAAITPNKTIAELS